jgi:hypothetical protein
MEYIQLFSTSYHGQLLVYESPRSAGRSCTFSVPKHRAASKMLDHGYLIR